MAGCDEGRGGAGPLLVLRRAGFTGTGDSDLLSCWSHFLAGGGPSVEEARGWDTAMGSPVGEVGVWGWMDEAPSARRGVSQVQNCGFAETAI